MFDCFSLLQGFLFYYAKIGGTFFKFFYIYTPYTYKTYTYKLYFSKELTI